MNEEINFKIRSGIQNTVPFSILYRLTIRFIHPWFQKIFLTMTGHTKVTFIIGFSSSAQDFFGLLHVPLSARVSGYLDLEFHNLSPFGLKIRKIYRKYA